MGDPKYPRRVSKKPKRALNYELKLDELKTHPEKSSLGISFGDEIRLIEKKLAETRRQIYMNLTPWQRVQFARHQQRPYSLDYCRTTFSDFSELHGDRLYSDGL